MNQARHGHAATGFILVTVLLDTIGFGIIAPVMPALITELTGEGVGQAALWGGRLTFVYALMQFAFAPILGNLSDRFGRRPVLLLSLLMLAADYALMAWAPNLAWLFLGRTLAGMAGATHATANAYISDVTAPEKRAGAFGLLGAAWGAGFILGPALGGLLGSYGARVPFWVAAALALVNVLYGLFVLPESLPPEKRRRFEFQRAHPVGALKQLGNVPVVIGLLAVMTIYMVAHDVNPSIWAYYMVEKFSWSELQIGLSLTFVGVTSMIVQGGLVGRVVARIGERRAALLGIGAMCVCFVAFAFASAGWMIYPAIMVGALGGLTGPSLRALMSARVSESRQGELAGAIASLQSLSAIISPLLMTGLFGYFSSATAPVYFPGAAYITAAAMVVVAAMVFTRVLRQTGRA